MWLNGLSTNLWTKGSPVRFPVRAHSWVAGQVPRGTVGVASERQPINVFLTHWYSSFSPSLSFSLKKKSINKIFKKKKLKAILTMVTQLINWNLKSRKKRYQCQYHPQCQDTFYLSGQSVSSLDTCPCKHMLPGVKAEVLSSRRSSLPSLLMSFFHVAAFCCWNRAIM